MSASHMLSYPLRLPDAVQADALRVLDASREVINATLVALWPRLDAFGTRESTYAYQQVTALIGPGSRRSLPARTAGPSRLRWSRCGRRTAMGARPSNCKA
jgi:hypothetical protein